MNKITEYFEAKKFKLDKNQSNILFAFTAGLFSGLSIKILYDWLNCSRQNNDGFECNKPKFKLVKPPPRIMAKRLVKCTSRLCRHKPTVQNPSQNDCSNKINPCNNELQEFNLLPEPVDKKQELKDLEALESFFSIRRKQSTVIDPPSSSNNNNSVMNLYESDKYNGVRNRNCCEDEEFQKNSSLEKQFKKHNIDTEKLKQHLSKYVEPPNKVD